MSNPAQEPFKILTSKTVVLTEDNIDTDQIIPARFLTTTERAGLGKSAFYDWRYDGEGRPKSDFILNNIDPNAHRILVGGRNFGCGSSREHAPWALTDFGFRVVISTEIADIFKSNSLKNGLLPVVVDEATHERLLAEPFKELTIDLEHCTLTSSDNLNCAFEVEAFARNCLLQGVDPLGFLMNQLPDIEKFEGQAA